MSHVYPADLRISGCASIPRKAGVSAAKEPNRYREEDQVGETRASLGMPELERPRTSEPAVSNSPVSNRFHGLASVRRSVSGHEYNVSNTKQ